MMTRILALDASSASCSAALMIDGDCHLLQEYQPQGHSDLLLQFIDLLCKEADLRLGELDAIAFGHGPGSFTGLRIAAGVAQGLAFAGGLPVIGISSLACLALEAWQQTGQDRILAAIDARMDEVYWGGYRITTEGRTHLEIPECVCAASRAPLPTSGGWVGAGDGWAAWRQALSERCGGLVTDLPSLESKGAASIGQLARHALAEGQLGDPIHAQPVYLRNQVVFAREAKTATNS